MQVTECKEISGRALDIDQNLSRSYPRRWRVRVDSPMMSPLLVLAANGIPRRFDPYVLFDTNGGVVDFDLGALCTKVNPKQDEDDPYVWYVDATYESVTGVDPADVNQVPGTQSGAGTGPQNTHTPPLLKPARIRYGLKNFTEPLRLSADYDTPDEFQAVKNSAGQQFLPLLEVERSRLTISVTRNEATFPASFALLFANSINNAAWNGFAKWTVKCNGITADKQFEESQIFYSVTYEFEVRSDDWRLKVYDAGLEQVDPDDATRTVKIKDKEGNPITEPRFLDGAGEVLPINADESDYVQLYFNGYPEEAFALLNITL